MTEKRSDTRSGERVQQFLLAAGALFFAAAVLFALPLGSMFAPLDDSTDDADADPASSSTLTDETTPTTSPTDPASGAESESDDAAEADAADGEDDDDAADPDDDDDEADDDDDGPVIERFELSDRSNPQWARVEVDWAVTAEDDDLETVRTELDGGVDSETSSVDGSMALGEHELRERDGHGEVEVTLIVTDEDGDTTTETKSIRLGNRR